MQTGIANQPNTNKQNYDVQIVIYLLCVLLLLLRVEGLGSEGAATRTIRVSGWGDALGTFGGSVGWGVIPVYRFII